MSAPARDTSAFPGTAGRSRAVSRRGSVLLLVLWMVIILGVAGLTYIASVRSQLSAEHMTQGRREAFWAARAGIERAMAELSQADLEALTDADTLFDDEENFRDQPVGDAASYSLQGQPDADGAPRYGLIDEGSRLSINRCNAEMLQNLNEAITSAMADSLLDWRDPDDEPRPEGAESETYEALDIPYTAANGPFQSVRELMRVNGWDAVFALATPDPYRLFYQSDEEAEAEEEYFEDQPAELTPETARALLRTLTAWSASPAEAPDDQEKVVLGEADTATLKNRLPNLTDDEATAIYVWARTRGFKQPAELIQVTAPTDEERQRAGLSATGAQGGAKVFALKRVGEIVDYCTARPARGNGRGQLGLININTAPREVLMAIPGLSEDLAETIVAERLNSGAFDQPGDLAELDGIDEDAFRRIYPWIATRTSRFHVTSRGFAASSGATVTIDAVLAADDPDKIGIVYWRED